MNAQTPATSRRTVVRGVAWSAPSLVLGAPAPALAASSPITFSHRTRWTWYSDTASWCSGQDALEISSVDAGTGVTFSGTTTSTRLTNVSATFYFTRTDIVWSRAGGDTGCWSIPTLQAGSVQATGSDGVTRTYYPYLTTYTCTITATASTTTLQGYHFRSQCYNVSTSGWAAARWSRRVATATINGAVNSIDTGVFQVQAG